jgi:hypothetical protein
MNRCVDDCLPHCEVREVLDVPAVRADEVVVVKATGHLTSAGHQLMIVAQTNEQVDDLVDRIAREHPGLALGRLHAGGHILPPRVTRHPNVTGSNQVSDLRDLPVVVSTAKKWSFVTPDKCAPWHWAIVDEAYQMRSDGLLATAPLFARDDSQILFVGDPGQLDPFATVETDRWHGLTWDPLRNAVDVTLAHKVETILFRDRDVPKGQININAEEGVVFLRGEVDRPELVGELEARVRAVKGVRAVENLLHLPGRPSGAAD